MGPPGSPASGLIGWHKPDDVRKIAPTMILATTKTIATLPHLATFLADRPDAVVGWGRKPSGRQATWLSKILRRPLALLEDGFIRSVERHSPPLSLLVDDIGVYYDANRPSRIEASIAGGTTDAQAARAEELVRQWCGARISKYNHAADYTGVLPTSYVLVVDQIAGDLSVAGGQARPESFAHMLDAALHENPGKAVVVKIHPDVHAKARRGYFSEAVLHHPRVQVIGDNCHGVRLIERADAVYCVTSLMGFEALLWDKPVRCFGIPFYAGWGLTSDEQRPPARRHDARREDVVHAALVTVARYANPSTGDPWNAEDAIRYAAEGRAALLARGQAMEPA